MEKVIPELLIIPHVFLVIVLDTLMTVMEKQENATIVFITPQVRLIIAFISLNKPMIFG